MSNWNYIHWNLDSCEAHSNISSRTSFFAQEAFPAGTDSSKMMIQNTMLVTPKSFFVQHGVNWWPTHADSLDMNPIENVEPQ